MEEQDRELVERAQDGDATAFRELVDRHAGNVFRLAARVTGNRETAEDVVQETFFKAHRRLRGFDNRARFGTWLYRIAMNCAIDQLRRERRRPQGVAGETGSLVDSVASESPDQDRLVQSTEIASAVGTVLASLTPRERAAFVLRHYQGCSIAEIAEILGVRTNACKSTIFRAVAKLREALRPLAREVL